MSLVKEAIHQWLAPLLASVVCKIKAPNAQSREILSTLLVYPILHKKFISKQSSKGEMKKTKQKKKKKNNLTALQIVLIVPPTHTPPNKIFAYQEQDFKVRLRIEREIFGLVMRVKGRDLDIINKMVKV